MERARSFPVLGHRGGLLMAAACGAVGVACLVYQPENFVDNPGYVQRIELAREVWLAAWCLGAALAGPGFRGFVAAWLGALAAAVPVVPLALTSSPTTAWQPFWIVITWVGVAVFTTAALGVAFGVAAGLAHFAGPPRGRRILGALLVLVGLAAVFLLALPAGPYTGPRPAPPAPSWEPP